MTEANTGTAATPFELDLMANAHRYQEWLAASVAPFLGSRILEVGSGVGTMTRHLLQHDPALLVASEPDPDLRGELERRASEWGAPSLRVQSYDPVVDGGAPFADDDLDTVVSFNVLEHIADDRAALSAQAEALRLGDVRATRNLIVFAPAHGWAYGEIDRAFHHYRRYDRGQLVSLLSDVAPGARVRARYLNVFGLPGWFLIGRVLRRSTFGLAGVHAMEAMLPALRPIDDALHSERIDLPFGQSVLAIATMPPGS